MTPPAAPNAMIESRSRVRRAGKILTSTSVTAEPKTAGKINIGMIAIRAYSPNNTPPL